MATFLAHIRVRPDAAARFEELARELYRASHTDERDVRRYEYWRGEEPYTYYTLASFPDFQGFLAHQTSAHHESAAPGLRDVIEVLRLEWVDPLAGASPLVPTEASPALPEASELERAYAERFAAMVQPWWQPLRQVDR
ncbi:MAG TPA: antibiotic biosynthesis monooxygenase [Acidimicrobiales bacterium]|nr:antibiotic biosynthesis monooxygenase [Acidimicrobiales bacterium]